MAVRTSATDPIRVAFVPEGAGAGPGRLGLTFAPGKHAIAQVAGGQWQRDLEADLGQLIEGAGADWLVSLLEVDEYDRLNIGNLRDRAAELGLHVLHLPIPDGGTPPDGAAFDRAIAEVVAALAAGKTVVVHCRGGLGRAGTVTAAVLVALGQPVDRAIALVRSVRPGAIENAVQEQCLAELPRRWGEGPPGRDRAIAPRP